MHLGDRRDDGQSHYSDGEIYRQFNICLTTRVIDGALAIGDELTDVRWIGSDGFEELSMHDTQRPRIGHFRQGMPTPYIG